MNPHFTDEQGEWGEVRRSLTGHWRALAGCLCLQARKTMWLVLSWAPKLKRTLHFESSNVSNSKIRLRGELLITQRLEAQVQCQQSSGSNPSRSLPRCTPVGELLNNSEPLLSHLENGIPTIHDDADTFYRITMKKYEIMPINTQCTSNTH